VSKFKYPRTPHLPFSEGRSDDDKVLTSLAHFHGREIVVTIKKDGENTSLYKTGFHARSLDSRHHSSRDWLAAFHASIAHQIPDDWRICGENLYARHSIYYEDLPSFFMAFSVWDETNTSLNWDDSLEFFSKIKVESVDELFRGVFDQKKLISLAKSIDTKKIEGFVIRLTDSFSYNEFGISCAKWVRPTHVQTDSHWMHQEIVPNRLKENKN
jgi:hypothetical protein